MKSATLKSLVQSGVITNISHLRFNSNGFPFVTVLSKDGKSQNLYFGRTTARIVMDNFQEKDNILDFLVDTDIVETENAQGEVRFKISKTLNSNYSSIASLADAFGIEVKNQDFDYSTFKQLFVGKKEVIQANAPFN